jgi:hypothetical protein
MMFDVDILDTVPDGPVSAPVNTIEFKLEAAATFRVDVPSTLTFPVVTLIRSVTIPVAPIEIVPDGFENTDEIILEVVIFDRLAVAIFELTKEAADTLSVEILARGDKRADTLARVTFARGVEREVTHTSEFKFETPATFADVLAKDVLVTFVVVREFETNRLVMTAVLFTVKTLLKV